MIPQGGGRRVDAQGLVEFEQGLHPHHAVVIQTLFSLEQSHPGLQRGSEAGTGQGLRLAVETGKQRRDLGYHRAAVTQREGSAEPFRRPPQQAVTTGPCPSQVDKVNGLDTPGCGDPGAAPVEPEHYRAGGKAIRRDQFK